MKIAPEDTTCRAHDPIHLRLSMIQSAVDTRDPKKETHVDPTVGALTGSARKMRTDAFFLACARLRGWQLPARNRRIEHNSPS